MGAQGDEVALASARTGARAPYPLKALGGALGGGREDLSDITVFAMTLAFTACLAIGYAVVLSSGPLHYDMTEAYSWGREFQLGYHQHPPFWAWVSGLWFLALPRTTWAFGLLSAINAGLGLFGAWLAIGAFATGPKRIAATALLALAPCYSIAAYKYNANIIFISIWPFLAYFFIKAIDTNRLQYSLLFGAMAAVALLSKYFAVLPLASCGIAAAAHPRARAYFHSYSPYLSAAVAAALCLPHVIWLVSHQAPPVYYFLAQTGDSWMHWMRYPADALFGILKVMIAPAAVIVYFARGAAQGPLMNLRRRWADPRFRVFAAIAIGPIALALIAAIAFRIRIVDEMLVGFFPFLPLLLIEVAGPLRIDRLASAAQKLARAAAAAFVLLSAPFAIAATYFGAYANCPPYTEAVDEALRLWREQAEAPLVYVAGEHIVEFEAAFRSPDRPHSFTNFGFDYSPWVSSVGIAESGLLAICRASEAQCLAATAFWTTPNAKQTRVEARHAAWGHVGPLETFVITVIPPAKRKTP